MLDGAVDSQKGIGDQTWDNLGYRGFDAGENLKTTSGWYLGGNGSDLFSFSGLPGGTRFSDGSFDSSGVYGNWWTSTESNTYNVWLRYLGYNDPGVDRDSGLKGLGYSVRCLRDN